MLDSILRPVALPPALFGRPAPCDFFDARGTLLLRAGARISIDADEAPQRRRVFCEARQAERISPTHPIAQLRRIGGRLSSLARLAAAGEPLGVAEFAELARETFEVWSLDADACLGYVRLVQFDRPSVCQALRVALFAAEVAAANGLQHAATVNVIGAALTMNLADMALHDQMHDLSGSPDEDARKAIDAHPARTLALLERIGGFPRDWLDAVAQHHENIDGSGYPLGLRGAAIALPARMLRIADTLAARLSGRSRRPPRHWSLHQARDAQHLVRHVFGTDIEKFDLTLLRLLMARLGAFPPGSLVRLSNGELAVVSRRRPDPKAAPLDVFAFRGAHGRPLDEPRMRRIGPRDCKIQSYAHDELPRLPAYDWPQFWGYRH
jgi:hypothetical protein